MRSVFRSSFLDGDKEDLIPQKKRDFLWFNQAIFPGSNSSVNKVSRTSYANESFSKDIDVVLGAYTFRVRQDVDFVSSDIDETNEVRRNQFTRAAKNEPLEYGTYSACDKLVMKWAASSDIKIGEVVQDIYVKNSSSVIVLLALIKAISCVDYKSIYPFGQMIAIAALANKDCEVNEAGIRAFEQWEDKDGIPVLSEHVTREKWLDDYRLETLRFLEEI